MPEKTPGLDVQGVDVSAEAGDFRAMSRAMAPLGLLLSRPKLRVPNGHEKIGSCREKKLDIEYGMPYQVWQP